jgi:hypothetical protein
LYDHPKNSGQATAGRGRREKAMRDPVFREATRIDFTDRPGAGKGPDRELDRLPPAGVAR